MATVRQWFYRLKINNKIIALFVPLVIIPMLAFGIYSNYLYQDISIKRKTVQSLNDTEIMKERLNDMISNANNCANMTSLNINQVYKEKENKLLSVEMKWSIENQLDYSLVIFDDLNKAIYVDKNNKVYASDGLKSEPDLLKLAAPYVTELVGTSGYNIWFETTKLYINDVEINCIPIGKSINSIETGKNLGYLILFLDENQLSDAIRYSIEIDKSEISLINRKNVVSASSNNQLIGEQLDLGSALQASDGILKNKVDNQNLMIKKTLNNKWLMLYNLNFDEFTKEMKGIRIAFVLATFVSVLLEIIIIYKLSAIIVNPIKKLSNQMEKAHELNNSIVTLQEGDEIAHLEESFNGMMNRIDGLILRVTQEEIQKHKYELALFQSQIKPHFLSNTLDTIYIMAHMGKMDEVKKATKALAEFYRLSLCGGDEIISISEEIEIAKRYLYIQKIRYSDILDYSFEIDEEILSMPILKLTIQPLIENALYHGIKDNMTKGNILIKGFKTEENTILQVIDDGIGMQKEFITQLLSQSKTTEHFGILNIDKRLKLYYGENYGLAIESEMHQGTTVNIILPR